MPHLLVAGSTGSGKTVCINAIIASLVTIQAPEDVRFIMVDPKIVEMKVYNDLPHMLIPVVTEPKKVPGAPNGSWWRWKEGTKFFPRLVFVTLPVSTQRY